jgi:hypothetical protein
MEIKELLVDLAHEIDSTLSTDPDGALPHEVFLEWCVGELTELGETEDLVLSNFGQTGQAVHGYSFSDYDSRLDLYITEYKNTTEEYTLYKTDSDASVNRLKNFIDKTFAKKNKVDVHHPAYDLIDLMAKTEISILRIFLFTNGKSTITRTEDMLINKINVQTHIWDINRFLRFKSSGNYIENTDVITKEFKVDFIPCSSADNNGNNSISNPEISTGSDGGINTYLCVFKGDFLADVYYEFTSRLLERNVRSFLGFKPVNKGILNTIEEEPDKFIAYNNGLTATATGVEINKEQNKITKIYGLQIVNGGQTTNAIYRAKYSNKLDLKNVFVPVKLCVLSEQQMDELGTKISKFANTQNVIKRTDLTSNHPTYRELERLSRSIIAPAKDGSQVETQWFFERARGQYMDEISRSGTPAKKRAFESKYPKQQKIDKSLLCRYWGCWYQEYEDVSQSAEKYHPIFIDDLDKNKNKFDPKNDEVSFQKLIAMAIIHKSTYKRVREKKYGYSYPTNVAEYTIALISNLSSMKVDLIDIWKRQSLSDEFIENIDYIAPIVGDTIKDLCETEGLIARELAKGRKVRGKNLWTILQDKNLSLPATFKIDKNIKIDAPKTTTGKAPLTVDQEKAVGLIKKLDYEELWALASWAKETDNLQSWQRGIVGSVATRLSRSGEPSGKQAVQVEKALDEARKLGFKFEKISD